MSRERSNLSFPLQLAKQSSKNANTAKAPTAFMDFKTDVGCAKGNALPEAPEIPRANDVKPPDLFHHRHPLSVLFTRYLNKENNEHVHKV